ncbi:hypothetical protein M2U04_28815, partial [Klebsiella pneumoniae]|uniref:hypothetical protein n=2 Tax=Enterobacteriaceae TaxID=543 RepID=UPI002ABC65DC|nr:hypothetical protein [Klebsiella pneumoniae]MDZ0947072.1 hypothetical protein [Klebsiella pneumoniae]MDZ1340366.1 hypothetical protein [Klebsiella pneumoniae]
RTLSETPEGNLKWLAATSTAGTPDRQAAAKATFSTESADLCRSSRTASDHSQPDRGPADLLKPAPNSTKDFA